MDASDTDSVAETSVYASASSLLIADVEAASAPDPSVRLASNASDMNDQHSRQIATGASADAASTRGGSELNQLPIPAANPKVPSSEPKPPMCSCPSERNLVLCIDGTANQFGLKVLLRRRLFHTCDC
jgi:hypothetical protein